MVRRCGAMVKSLRSIVVFVKVMTGLGAVRVDFGTKGTYGGFCTTGYESPQERFDEVVPF